MIDATQINLYLTNPSGDDVLQHDCIHLPTSMEKETNTYEIVTYCLSENRSKWKIEENNLDQKLMFAQLYEQNITSEQLWRWSTPIDVAEHYQSYVNQRSISGDSHSTASHIFHNCSSARFGPSCEYSLDIQELNDRLLKDIIDDYYQAEYRPTTLTCYEQLVCDRGSTLACLDWSEICDGYVDCLNDAVDEHNCWQLEINECAEDEYRCSNGQCIAKVFFRDHPRRFECLDRSDGTPELLTSVYSIKQIPSITTEDVICPTRAHLFLFKITSSCTPNRDIILKESMFLDRPNTLSDICWLALKCLLSFTSSIDPRCPDLCPNKVCQQTINGKCPEVILTPANALAFGHMYLAYSKTTIVNSTHTIYPHYVCYKDTLCGGFLPNKTLLAFNNLTCRRLEDFPVSFVSAGRFSRIDIHLRPLYTQLHQCNTIAHRNFVRCNSSMTYQCRNSLKCISKYRLCDGKNDCDYKDDEDCPLINGTCSTHPSDVLFPCTESGKCISLNLIDNGVCDCGRDQYGLCDDESSILRSIRKDISFPTICDGFLEVMPVVIDGRNETDESECQHWQCNNTYTRCDGHWNCFNGADEVDVSTCYEK